MSWRTEKKICLFFLVSLLAAGCIAGGNESSSFVLDGADNQGQVMEHKTRDIVSQMIIEVLFAKEKPGPEGKTLSEALAGAILQNLRAKL